RAAVDKGIDWLINWIVTKAKQLFAKIFGKGKEKGKADEEGPMPTASFSMTGAGHSLSVAKKGNKYQITMASGAGSALSAKISKVQKDISSNKAKYPEAVYGKVIGQLGALAAAATKAENQLAAAKPENLAKNTATLNTLAEYISKFAQKYNLT